MVSYSKVCEILTDAVPMTTGFCPRLHAIIPSDGMLAESIRDIREIKKKIQENYVKWADDS